MNQYVYDATQQKWFVNQWERRMSELEKMRLAGKFGKKNEYFDWECKAMFEELERAGLNEEGSDLDAIEVLFKKLNEADEAAKARSTAMGWPRPEIALLGSAVGVGVILAEARSRRGREPELTSDL